MKKLLLILSIATMVLSESKAQYHPMLGDTTQWCLAWNFVLARSHSRMFDNQTFDVTGDTLMDSTNYKRLFIDGNTYYGALREDSTQQKVYFIKSGDTTETLLYDFSLIMGDTMVVDLQNNILGNMNDGNYIVDSVGFITIRGGTRKYLRLHNPLNTSLAPDGKPLKLEWIESVGDVHYTIYTYAYDNFGVSPMQWSCGLQHESAIMKQTINNTKNYVDICVAHNVAGIIDSDTCSITYVGGIHEQVVNASINIFPNPSNGNEITIYFNTTIIRENTMVLITDETGKKIYTNTVKPFDNSVKLTNIQLENGIYLVQVNGNQNIIAPVKLIVNNAIK